MKRKIITKDGSIIISGISDYIVWHEGTNIVEITKIPS